jgi:secreted trypsin-like serine protease
MALAVALTAASPIIIRHDRPDEAYRALGERFADVNAVVTGRADGRVYRGQGTLIGPTWILTAAHVVRRDGDYEVQVDGRSYRVARIVLHPLFSLEAAVHDIALLELAEPVQSDRYAQLYRGADEAGLGVIKIGTGGFGDGVTGFREQERVLRGATNRVAVVDEWRLEFVFDAPGSEHVTELEGIAGPGDSGNAALIESGGRILIVGVGSHQRGSGDTQGKYGVTEVYERVSAYADWIDQVISASVRSEK